MPTYRLLNIFMILWIIVALGAGIYGCNFIIINLWFKNKIYVFFIWLLVVVDFVVLGIVGILNAVFAVGQLIVI